MARTDQEIEKILAEHREKSKGVVLDINGNEATYQEASELKPPELPAWAQLHLRAYGIKVKPQATNPE